MAMCVSIDKTFEAAHRLLNHPGKCRFLHGHSYNLTVTIGRKDGGVGPRQMVIDFGNAKEIINAVVDGGWDHNTILNAIDPLAKRPDLIGRDPMIVSCTGHDQDPTAEMIALRLKEDIESALNGRFPNAFEILNVVVKETDKCSAEWYPDR